MSPGEIERVFQELARDWIAYGEIHVTNANGLTRLDPTRITYDEAPGEPEAPSQQSAPLLDGVTPTV